MKKTERIIAHLQEQNVPCSIAAIAVGTNDTERLAGMTLANLAHQKRIHRVSKGVYQAIAVNTESP